MAVLLGCTSTGRVGLCFLWFFVQELLEAQPAVVLVLKRLRRRGKWLEVSSDRLGELGRVPWLYQYWPGGFMLCVVLCPGTPEGSTGSGSGFKASQKTGQRLKVSSDRLCEAKPQGGYSNLFRIRRLGPSIYRSPPKNIRNFKHPKKIFEILATQKNIPILYLDLKKRL